MATGDNVLTAISVARQCNIINGEKNVWLGDVDQNNNQQNVVWKSTDGKENNSVVSLGENSLPWHYLDRNIEVALTGKALKLIIQ